jgi:molecular chaperone DnaJ
MRTDVRGDLHAHIEVVVPTKLDARTRELLGEVKSRNSRRWPMTWRRTA